MLIATVPALFALVGLLVYVLASNAKAVEIGRLMFAVALLVALFAFERVLP